MALQEWVGEGGPAKRKGQRTTRHLKWPRPQLAPVAQLEAGQLVCAGATGTPPDGGLFLFRDVSREDVEAFVAVQRGEHRNHAPGWLLCMCSGQPQSVSGYAAMACEPSPCEAVAPRHTSSRRPPRPAQADPYFKNGLITSYKISSYAVAVGEP